MFGNLVNVEKNVGYYESLARIGGGILLISMAAFYGDGKGDWIGWIGLVPLFSGVIGFCPVYKMLGINTCGSDDGKKK
jgi:hypothetical protein